MRACGAELDATFDIGISKVVNFYYLDVDILPAETVTCFAADSTMLSVKNLKTCCS